tara:strand:+ start:8524 stop:8841 length:318 start_codon:yes stop_codon:yes gene_type:complete
MKSSWVKTLIPAFLTFVLLLPYGGSLFHLFEDHEHKTCDISIVHLHEIDFDCDVFDYYFTPKIEGSYSITYHNFTIFNKLNFSLSSRLFFESLINPYLLRGPPIA